MFIMHAYSPFRFVLINEVLALK